MFTETIGVSQRASLHPKKRQNSRLGIWKKDYGLIGTLPLRIYYRLHYSSLLFPWLWRFDGSEDGMSVYQAPRKGRLRYSGSPYMLEFSTSCCLAMRAWHYFRYLGATVHPDQHHSVVSGDQMTLISPFILLRTSISTVGSALQ